WPRHNPDFSMFRVYASKENKPAEYNPDNVPYKPAYSFPVSLKGYEKGDFTMVYGFPGRTQEYLTSYAVDLLMNEQNPRRVSLRGKRLAIYEASMKKNDTLRLMYADRYAGIANAYKKWSGETIGLKVNDAVNKKKALENSFLEQLAADPAKKEKYTQLLLQMKKLYLEYAPLSKQVDYYAECLMGIDALRYINNYQGLFAELKKKKSGKENKFDQQLSDLRKTIPFRNFNKETDINLCVSMLNEYEKNIEKYLRPVYLDSLFVAYNNDTKKIADFLYSNSPFVDNLKAKAMFDDIEKNSQVYENDPFYKLAVSITSYYSKVVFPQYNYDEMQILEMQKEYMLALKENLKWKKFYPDANGTLRVAYGKVDDYKPKDGVEYQHYTTIDGMIEKNATGNPDYEVMPRLIELYNKKDFGQYADKKGKLRVSFIASNHTTGGNSGSPVLNAKGELIGTNYDRNWEGTMSDVMYDVNRCRNIVLDVRFTLWVIDKYAGAGYLLNEMKLVK
ncbi:MAG: S46 family peptidase, partial [Bacteroidia bacterium]|nr:S46 family peptidase [Bacteroidia bacterium]